MTMTSKQSEKQKRSSALSVSLRTVLTTPYVLLVLMVIAIVGMLSFLNSQGAVNNVARQLRNETALRIQQHLLTFLNIPHQINQLNAYAIQHGELQPDDVDALHGFFLEQVRINPSVSSVYFGNTKGGIIGSGREGAEGSLYVTFTEQLESGTFQKYGVDGFGTINSQSLTSVPNFDARERPWYISAADKGDATWSDIYILFTRQDMAIAASRPIYDHDGNLLGVTSVDIFLSQISKYLESLNISPLGQIYIMEHSGALVATSTGEALFNDINNDGVKERIHADESQSPEIQQSNELLLQKYKDYKRVPEEEQQLEFSLKGEKQFLQYLSVRDPYGIDWIVVVITPESAFMGQVDSGNGLILWLLTAAMMITMTISIFITSKITNRISQLDDSAHALASGEWNFELDTSARIEEFNRLAVSFNKMKGQIQSNLESLTKEVTERLRTEKHASQISKELQTTLDTVIVGISHVKNHKVIWANHAHDQMFGYVHGDTYGMETKGFFADERAYRKLAEDSPLVLLQGETYQLELELKRRDGTRFWCEIAGRMVNPKQPEEGVIWMLHDVTERKKVESELKNQRDFATQIINLMGQGLTVTNTDGNFEFVNPAYARLFGYDSTYLLGKHPKEFTVTDDHQKLTEQWKLRTSGKTSSYESLLRRADGSTATVLITGVPRSVDGKFAGAIAVITDLTEQKRIEDELRHAKDSLELINTRLEQAIFKEQHLAHTDSLTGINNRRYLFDLANIKMAIASRYKQPLSAMMFDIDHFKKINDLHGHLVGDQILIEIVNVVQAEMRKSDVIGRYGGEEFVILLPMTTAQQAHKLAERIRLNVEALRVPSERGDVSATISIGIVEIDHQQTVFVNVEELFSRADEAMYTAKRRGRNRVVILRPK